jgi:hypothetical protein
VWFREAESQIVAREAGSDRGDLEGHCRTVRSPSEIDPTNFRLETVLEAMVSVRSLESKQGGEDIQRIG